MSAADGPIHIPIPARWHKVRFVLNAAEELDSLERALLRLAGLEPRTAEALAQRLGLQASSDMVEAALESLVDRGLATHDPETGRYSTVEEHDAAGSQLVAGWVAEAACGGLLPRIWTEQWPPRRYQGPAPEGSTKGPPPSFLSRSDLIRELRKLARERSAVCVDSDVTQRRHAEDQPAGEPLSVATEILLDQLVEPMTGTVWAEVELLPAMAGAATIVVHAPELGAMAEWRVLPARPVKSYLPEWCERNVPEWWDVVRRKADDLNRVSVLRLAGIQDDGAIEAAAAAHRDGQLRGLGIDEAELPVELLPRLKEAQWWFLLARRAANWDGTAKDKYSHAIEALAGYLRVQSGPLLGSWRSRVEKLRGDARRVALERGACRLADPDTRRDLMDRLGPSFPHLEVQVKRTNNLLADIALQEPGAGGSVTLWILPAVLVDPPEGPAWLARLRALSDVEPYFFSFVDKLVKFRNATFHERQQAFLLDEIDQALVRVLAAIGKTAGPGGGSSGE